MNSAGPSLLPTIVVPALVAAFVTLLIEFLARPYLELRKERILEKDRETRELRRKIANLASFLERADFESGVHMRDKARIREFILELRRRANAITEVAVPAEFLPEEIRYSLAGERGRLGAYIDVALLALGTGKGSVIADETVSIIQRIFQMAPRFGLPLEYVSTPRWRLLRRRKVRRAASARSEAERERFAEDVARASFASSLPPESTETNARSEEPEG